MSAHWTRRYFIASSLAMTGMLRAQEKSGLILAQGDPGFEAARQPFNSVIDLQPALIAPCRTEADVVTAVRLAADKGLPVAVKSGGHAFHGFNLNQGGLVVELSNLRSLQYDQSNQQLTAGPGLKLRDTYSGLSKYGRFLPAGSCGGVGLSGLTLGGGYGLFSREFGLTCDHLERVRLVDGNGEIHDSRDEPDLLWACRGGGNGNFGVITSMTFKTRATPGTLASWNLKSRGNDAGSLKRCMEAWFEVVGNLPSPVFSALVLNGTQATVLLTSTRKSSGPAFQAAGRALKSAGFTTSGPVDRPFASAIKRYEGRPGPLPFNNVSAGYYKGYADLQKVAHEITQTVIDTPGLIFQINTLGGEIANGPDAAYPHREWPFLGELQAYWQKGPIPARLDAGHARIRKILADAGITRHYRNYPDPNLENWESSYFSNHYERLQQIKTRLDPEDRIRHPQSVRLAKR